MTQVVPTTVQTPEFQWLVDWFFLQRTEEQCHNLFAEAGYDMDRPQTVRDETGMIISFIARTRLTDSSVPLRYIGDQAAELPAQGRKAMTETPTNKPGNLPCDLR